MSQEIYRCRKCGKLMTKPEVHDIDGMHYCLDCALARNRDKR